MIKEGGVADHLCLHFMVELKHFDENSEVSVLRRSKDVMQKTDKVGGEIGAVLQQQNYTFKVTNHRRNILPWHVLHPKDLCALDKRANDAVLHVHDKFKH